MSSLLLFSLSFFFHIIMICCFFLFFILVFCCCCCFVPFLFFTYYDLPALLCLSPSIQHYHSTVLLCSLHCPLPLLCRTFPRLVGECGGKNYHLIHKSADLENVAYCSVRGAVEYSGQKCSATARMYVPESCWPEVGVAKTF